MRALIDTNVYISALMFGGLLGLVLDLALARSFDTIISPSLLQELGEKLQTKFQVPEEDARLVISKIEGVAILIVPRITLAVVRDDPDDDRVLECAVEGLADVIVSGDRHLLKMRSFRGISMLNVRRFIESLDIKGA